MCLKHAAVALTADFADFQTETWHYHQNAADAAAADAVAAADVLAAVAWAEIVAAGALFLAMQKDFASCQQGWDCQLPSWMHPRIVSRNHAGSHAASLQELRPFCTRHCFAQAWQGELYIHLTAATMRRSNRGMTDMLHLANQVDS